MKLRHYIARNSAASEPLGRTNSVIRRIAIVSGLSTHMVYRISIGSRHASPDAADAISKATGGKVKPQEMKNAHRKKPGPKPRWKSSRTGRGRRKQVGDR